MNGNMMDTLQQELANQSGHIDPSMLTDISMAGLAVSLVFGIIGLAIFRHGKKNGPLSSMIYGGLLMAYPYFVTDVTYMIAMGIVLTVLPFVFRFG